MRIFREQRGAAVTEFAISLIVLLPLAFYATYISEAYSGAIKAQEAEVTASWEVSAYRLHNYTNGNELPLYASAMRNAEARVDAELFDMDSFGTRAQYGRSTMLANIGLGRVRCSLRNYGGNQPRVNKYALFVAIPTYKIGDPDDTYNSLTNARPAWEYLHQGGFVACKDSVFFDNSGFDAPSQSVDAAFHLSLPLMPAARRTFSMCGNGPGLRGCSSRPDQGGLVTLTDDWALEDSRPQRLGSPPGAPDHNAKYYRVGQSIYGGGLGSYAVRAEVRYLTGPSAGQTDFGKTNEFKMEYEDRVSTPRTTSAIDASIRGSTLRAHLTPYDDTPVTKSVYDNERVNSNYLGKRPANWNGQ